MTVDLSYPPRSLALHIIEAMADPTVANWDGVAARVGLANGSEANGAAHRCFQIYGYGALQPNLVALWNAQRSMVPRPTSQPSQQPTPRVDPWRPLSDAESAQR